MTQTHTTHPLIQAVKNLLSRFTQSPEIYPIKYYKKNMRHRNSGRMEFVK